MKKKLFLAFLILTMLICIFALSVSAEEANAMNYDRTYTLDGVSYPLWEQDGEGNYHPLIWYLNGENEMRSVWADGEADADGTYVNLSCFEGQLSKMTVYESDGASYTSDLSFVIVNLNEVQLNHKGEPWPIKYVHAKAFHTNTTINNVTELKLNENNVLKAVFLPNTLVHIGWAQFHVANTVAAFYSFNNCTALEYVEFHKDTQLDDKTLNRGAFLNCSSLKALSLPDCITTIGNAALADCSSLEAVYLSQDLTTLSNGGNPFANNSNLYFVNESFIMNSSEDIPQKPEVYCFPSGLTSFGAAILSPKANKTVVISENVTSHSTKMFAGSGVETVVYLGNMTSFKLTLEQTTKLNVLMPNTTAQPTVSATGNTNGSSVYLCELNKSFAFDENSWKDATVHIEDPSKSAVIKEPNCVENAWKNTYCFCGAYMGEVEISNSNNGEHDLENAIVANIVYGDFTSIGTKVLKCPRCSAEDITGGEAPALFTCLGYSAAEYGDMMSVNYRVNEEAISEYEEATGEKISYGVFAVTKKNIEKNDIFDAEGNALSGVIAADITGAGFNLFSLKITGFTEAQKELPFAMGAFVGTEKDGATEYSYLQIAAPAEGEKYYFATYNEVVALVPSDDENV